MVDGNISGFVMVNNIAEMDNPCDYSIAEFFVMYKYRRMGVGQFAANAMFDKFKGRWQLKRHPKNLGAVHFWDKVISDYTKDNFILHEAVKDTEYADGSLGDVFDFLS